ncbi:MAG: LarC family nickel insertion protein, partial [Planctomycetaceae bacterium]|nr:LarC family nickel insertion protein [Planctomycetaceae bacterium]
EVGAADSIADIVGAAVGLDWLQLDAIYASPVPTGTGTIKIAHGTCSVPAPATAELLRGVPIAASDVPFELTTPTGAAILATTVKAFVPMPAMTMTTIGSGAGGRDLPNQANLLRLIIGTADGMTDVADRMTGEAERDDHAHAHSHEHNHAHEHHHDGDHSHDHAHVHSHEHEHHHEHSHGEHDHVCCDGRKRRSQYDHDEIVWVLETNLDDMSGEMIGYCIEKLWQAEPLDVYTAAIQMKKQRPGVKLTVLCRGEQIERIETILFEHTTTLGIRRVPALRDVLQREPARVETPWGSIDGKTAFLPDGTKRFAPEFESAKRVADAHNVTLDEVYTAAKAALQQTNGKTR